MVLKKTITTIFMVPTLKLDKNKLKENNFINAYIRDENRDFYDNCIYLLFKPEDLDIFREFVSEEYEKKNSVLVEDYDYPGGYVVMVYKLDYKFKKDFDLVKWGKYSKTSLAFQELFPKVVSIKSGKYVKEEVSLQYRVFNRTEDLIHFWEEKLGVTFDSNQEVWHGFEEEKEVLNNNNLVQEDVQ